MTPSLQDFAIKLFVSAATKPVEEVVLIRDIDVCEDDEWEEDTIKMPPKDMPFTVDL